MRILALDVGKRRIGIAVSDPLAMIAQPHSTIERTHDAPAQIAQLAKQLDVERILIGLPLHLDGKEGKQANDVRAFAAKLLPLIEPIPVEYRDERLTTVEAQERLSAHRKGDWRKTKNRVDAAAAAVILEDYLSSR